MSLPSSTSPNINGLGSQLWGQSCYFFIKTFVLHGHTLYWRHVLQHQKYKVSIRQTCKFLKYNAMDSLFCSCYKVIPILYGKTLLSKSYTATKIYY